MTEQVKDISLLLARRVLSLRTDQLLTQAQLAARAGVTTETIARIERVLRGRPSASANPSLETLRAIAESLGVEVPELLMEGGVKRRKNDASFSFIAELPKEMRRRIEAVARALVKAG